MPRIKPMLLLALAALLSQPVLAEDPIYTGRFSNVAIKGFDPVAYFSESKPRKGSADFTLTWQGAEWRFVSAANRETFSKDPLRWAPQYGGYCSWAVSQGYTAGIDPEAWSVVNNKLYLNYSLKIQQRWEQDRTSNIEAADANWPDVLN